MRRRKIFLFPKTGNSNTIIIIDFFRAKVGRIMEERGA